MRSYIQHVDTVSGQLYSEMRRVWEVAHYQMGLTRQEELGEGADREDERRREDNW